ncbi:hypothetical protein ASG12_07600 [Williamsia sp. Leaf354]|nr:hypothetical protein ASG12_07600 [Williamsia sp. Leaf354]
MSPDHQPLDSAGSSASPVDATSQSKRKNDRLSAGTALLIVIVALSAIAVVYLVFERVASSAPRRRGRPPTCVSAPTA